MRALFVFFLVIPAIIGCSTTLDAPEVSGHLAKREELRQKQMAAELKKKRESHLYQIKRSLEPGINQLCPYLVSSEEGCHYSIILVEEDKLNAYADGKKTYIHTGMIRFTDSDEELAFIVAHEMAHNMLAHIDKRRTNTAFGVIADLAIAATLGVNTQGAFGEAGSKAYSQAFEAESDYLALYLLAKTGYDITNVPDFWRRMGVEHPDSISKIFNSTHPSTPERFVAMEATVIEIQDKQRSGQQLIPNFAGATNLDENKIRTDEVNINTGPSNTEVPRVINSQSRNLSMRPVGSTRDVTDLMVGSMRFTVEKLAMENGCFGVNSERPSTELLEITNIQERYLVNCRNSNQITINCRYQQCLIVDNNQDE